MKLVIAVEGLEYETFDEMLKIRVVLDRMVNSFVSGMTHDTTQYRGITASFFVQYQ